MRISDWSSAVCSSHLAPSSSSPTKRESIMPNPLLAPLMRWFGRLSYPKLFLLPAALFAGDVLVPDMIPFVDELLLGLGTLLLANWTRVRPGRGETIGGEFGRRDGHHAGRTPMPPHPHEVQPP